MKRGPCLRSRHLRTVATESPVICATSCSVSSTSSELPKVAIQSSSESQYCDDTDMVVRRNAEECGDFIKIVDSEVYLVRRNAEEQRGELAGGLFFAPLSTANTDFL